MGDDAAHSPSWPHHPGRRRRAGEFVALHTVIHGEQWGITRAVAFIAGSCCRVETMRGGFGFDCRSIASRRTDNFIIAGLLASREKIRRGFAGARS